MNKPTRGEWMQIAQFTIGALIGGLAAGGASLLAFYLWVKA